MLARSTLSTPVLNPLTFFGAAVLFAMVGLVACHVPSAAPQELTTLAPGC